jgi:hypothetical protein
MSLIIQVLKDSQQFRATFRIVTSSRESLQIPVGCLRVRQTLPPQKNNKEGETTITLLAYQVLRCLWIMVGWILVESSLKRPRTKIEEAENVGCTLHTQSCCQPDTDVAAHARTHAGSRRNEANGTLPVAYLLARLQTKESEVIVIFSDPAEFQSRSRVPTENLRSATFWMRSMSWNTNEAQAGLAGLAGRQHHLGGISNLLWMTSFVSLALIYRSLLYGVVASLKELSIHLSIHPSIHSFIISLA